MGNEKTALEGATVEEDLSSGGESDLQPSDWRQRLASDVVEDDERLERVVKNALLWSPFLTDVTFDVVASGGTVTLTGVSPYASLCRMAGTLAWTVPGVDDVINEIRVLAASNGQMRNGDRECNGFYRTTLWDSAL
jgi:hypothetical protein